MSDRLMMSVEWSNEGWIGYCPYGGACHANTVYEAFSLLRKHIKEDMIHKEARIETWGDWGSNVSEKELKKLEMTFIENSERIDCERIVRIFADRGEEISLAHAYIAWDRVSTSECANWLFLFEKDQDVYEEVTKHL